MLEDFEIRWHFPEEVELDPREPVIIQKLVTGTTEFVQCGVAPDHVRDMDSIRAYVRGLALARCGEAWRAVTQRGELLCAYSVSDLAEEMSGKPVITMHPRDQLCIAVARARMGVSLS